MRPNWRRFTLLPVVIFVAGLLRADSGSIEVVAGTPVKNAQFIGGVVNSEDLVQLPNTHWVISSGMTGPGVPVGHLFLINADEKTAETFYPQASNCYRQDPKFFANGPGKPDEKSFAATGINLRPTGNGIGLAFSNRRTTRH